VFNTTPRPQREPVPTGPEAGWAPRVRKISPPPGLDPQTVHPVSSRYSQETLEYYSSLTLFLKVRTGPRAYARDAPQPVGNILTYQIS
jgi:hypothetical protein